MLVVVVVGWLVCFGSWISFPLLHMPPDSCSCPKVTVLNRGKHCELNNNCLDVIMTLDINLQCEEYVIPVRSGTAFKFYVVVASLCVK